MSDFRWTETDQKILAGIDKLRDIRWLVDKLIAALLRWSITITPIPSAPEKLRLPQTSLVGAPYPGGASGFRRGIGEKGEGKHER